MNSDIRINVGFFDHHKTKRLERDLGQQGIICLLRLWIYAAVHRPEGILTGMDENDVAGAAGWDGEPGELISVLGDGGWIYKNESWILNNWEEHQPWAAGASKRSEAARYAAHAKHQKTKKLKESDGSADSCGPQESAYAPFLSLPYQEPKTTGPVKLDPASDEQVQQLKDLVQVAVEKHPDFNIHKFINTMAKDQKGTTHPPEVFSRVLSDLVKAKKPVENPWGFCKQRFVVHSQNVHFESQQQQHKENKDGGTVVPFPEKF